MSSFKMPAEGSPRVFLSLTSPGRLAQEAFVAALVKAVADHHMTPVRLAVDRGPSAVALDAVRQLMQTCQGTIVIAMARTHVVEGIEHANGKHGHRYRNRFVATEWVQIEGAIAYQLDHLILVLREDLVHPTGLLDPAVSGLAVCTFSLAGGGTEDIPRIARLLPSFRAKLGEHVIRSRRHG